MERKIGEIFEYNGEWYQCVKSPNGTCQNCDMNFDGKCPIPIKECVASARSDLSYVIFKKLEKVGEPYKALNRLFQAYKVFTAITDVGNYDVAMIPHYETIDIEIKQTKEDMEEKKPTNLDKNDEFGNVYTVYKHISPNGKEYVGMTRNIQKRWEGNGCSYTKNSEFRNDIMKYGWDNFKHIIIKDGLSLRKASELEDELIVDAMNRGVAYNIARGGIGGSHPAWNKGIPLSDEQKAKLIAANKGKKHSKEHTAKWKKSNKWRFRKIEIRKNEILVGTYDSIREASRKTGLSRGFINGTIRNPKGEHQGYTIIILD